MTGEQLDAYERRWKFTLLSFAVALVVDLAYIVALQPRGIAKAISYFIVAASIFACLLALKKLRHAGYTESHAGSYAAGDDVGDLDVSDIFDTFSADD
jgi:hypothetical protein